jgi:hypothetical protein
MRHQTREVGKVREDYVGLEAESSLERELDVGLEVDHLEAEGPQVQSSAPRRRETNLVSARDELGGHDTRSLDALGAVARDPVEDTHDGVIRSPRADLPTPAPGRQPRRL